VSALVGSVGGCDAMPGLDEFCARCFRGAGQPVEVKSELIVIGPLPLSKFFKPGSFQCAPVAAADCQNPEIAKLVTDALDSVEVYIIDKKHFMSSDFWIFHEGGGFPKIVLSQPLACDGGIARLELEKPCRAGDNSRWLPIDAPADGTGERRVRIRATLAWRIAGYTPFNFFYSSCFDHRRDIDYRDEWADYQSEIISYGLDGQLRRSDPGDHKWDLISIDPQWQQELQRVANEPTFSHYNSMDFN
jgi:hypothetical protein